MKYFEYLKKSNQGKNLDVTIGETGYAGCLAFVNTSNKSIRYIIIRVQRKLSRHTLGRTGYLHLFFHANGAVTGCRASNLKHKDHRTRQFNGTWKSPDYEDTLNVLFQQKRTLSITMREH